MRARRSFRGGRRVRPPMMWVPNIGAISVAAGAVQTVTLVDAIASATSGVPNVARMTIRSVVGSLLLIAGANGAGEVCCGIAVVGASDAGTTLALDPNALTSMDYPWMWLRNYYLEASNSGRTSYINQFGMPYGTDVRVKSKRILAPQERLVLFISNTTAATVSGASRLRTLVSRGI